MKKIQVPATIELHLGATTKGKRKLYGENVCGDQEGSNEWKKQKIVEKNLKNIIAVETQNEPHRQ